MVKNESVNLEDFFFFLHDHPHVSPYGREDFEIERLYNNNIKWTKKIFKQLINTSIKQEQLLSIKILWKETYPQEQMGLDAWM